MKKLLVVLVIVVAFVFGGYLWWKNNTQPVNATDPSRKIFVIKQGENIRDIANDLKTQGLIRDPIVFFLIVKQKKLESNIQAGDFRISASQSPADIAETLTHGIVDVWVTIPEGKRAEEIAAIFKDKLPEFQNAWTNDLTQNEGYLFPDTYLIPRTADSSFIIKMMRKNFDDHFGQVLKSTITDPKLTNEQKLTMASLIEREARFADDRPIVASVIYNRLKVDMPLQIDAAVQYAIGYDPQTRNWWKKNLTKDDLNTNSPFNTYTNTGLPPHPIANPGLSAINAAFNPAKTYYLYYVSDAAGHLHYAKTLDEHNANIHKYLGL